MSSALVSALLSFKISGVFCKAQLGKSESHRRTVAVGCGSSVSSPRDCRGKFENVKQVHLTGSEIKDKSAGPRMDWGLATLDLATER